MSHIHFNVGYLGGIILSCKIAYYHTQLLCYNTKLCCVVK